MPAVSEVRTIHRVAIGFSPLCRQQIGLVRCRYPQAVSDFINVLPAFLNLFPEERIEDWLHPFSTFALQDRTLFTCYLRQSVRILKAGRPLESLSGWAGIANRFMKTGPEEVLTLLRATAHLYGAFGQAGCERTMGQFERLQAADKDIAAVFGEALSSLPLSFSLDVMAKWVGTLIEHLPELLSLKTNLLLPFFLFSHRVLSNEGVRVAPVITNVLPYLPRLDRWTAWLLLEKLSRWSVLFCARSIKRWCSLFVDKIFPCHDIGLLFLALTDQMWRYTSPDLVCRIFSALPFDERSSDVRKRCMELVGDILDTRPELFSCAPFMESLLRLSAGCHDLALSFYQALIKDSLGRFGDISPEKLSVLVSRGLELYRREGLGGASRFLSLESREGVQFFMDLYGGYRLETAVRRLNFYRVGISDRHDLALRSAGQLEEGNDERFIFCTDGSSVYLPESIGIFPLDELNYLVYKTGLSHEIGHIEFGSFGLDLEKLREVLVFLERTYYPDSERLWKRQVMAALIEWEKENRGEAISDFERFFTWFPCRSVAVEIFNLVEDTRIDTILCRTYSGLEDDFAWINDLVWPKRPALASLSTMGQVLEVLLQREYWGQTRDPVEPRIAAFVDRLLPFIEKVKRLGASVEDSAWSTAHMYVMLDEFLGCETCAPGDGMTIVVRLPYRGKHFPGIVRKKRRDIMSFSQRGGRAGDWPQIVVDVDARSASEKRDDAEGVRETNDRQEAKGEEDTKFRQDKEDRRNTKTHHERDVGDSEPTCHSKTNPKESRSLTTSPDRKQSSTPGKNDRKLVPGAYHYDEWDGSNGVYLRGHCTVIDEVPPSNLRVRKDSFLEIEQGRKQISGDDDEGENGLDLVGVPAQRIYEAVLRKYGKYVQDLKNRMAFLKPEGMRLCRGFEDGEVLDVDRALEMAVDVERGVVPDDRVFRRLVRKDRNIALLVLVDVSNSTGDLTPNGRTIILVEIEALVLLNEAVHILQDTCAIYAFSSLGPEVVNLLRVKDFEEAVNVDVKGRIGGLKPMSCTRMGAAIRHSIHLLRTREEKTKILLLLTDGWPFYYENQEFCSGYALDDTACAVREAREQKIHTVCVSIDGQEKAHQYLPAMFGEGNYRIIMQPEQLPLHLAELYRQLTR